MAIAKEWGMTMMPVMNLYAAIQHSAPAAVAQEERRLRPASFRPAPKPRWTPTAFHQTGLASWYGGAHHYRTATGERYNPRGLTAAHRWLPLNTRIRVTDLRNGRSVTVRINDRGPFVRGRIVDLSAGAARALHMKAAGVVPVRIVVLGNKKPPLAYQRGFDGRRTAWVAQTE